jgi:hypothetical protein
MLELGVGDAIGICISFSFCSNHVELPKQRTIQRYSMWLDSACCDVKILNLRV